MILANGLPTMTTERCICGEVCQNKPSLKIHQSQMKYLVMGRAAKCTGSISGQGQEEPSLQTPHRAQTLQVLSSPTPIITPSDQVASSKTNKESGKVQWYCSQNYQSNSKARHNQIAPDDDQHHCQSTRPPEPTKPWTEGQTRSTNGGKSFIL